MRFRGLGQARFPLHWVDVIRQRPVRSDCQSLPNPDLQPGAGKHQRWMTYSESTSSPSRTTTDFGEVGKDSKRSLIAQWNVDHAVVANVLIAARAVLS